MTSQADRTGPLAPGPEGSPELGSLRELQQDPLAFFLDCRRRFGDVVRFRIGPERVVYLVSDPDAIRQILVVNRRNYTKGESWKKVADPNAPESSRDLTRRGSLLPFLANRHDALAYCYSMAGRRRDAIASVKRAMALQPANKKFLEHHEMIEGGR